MRKRITLLLLALIVVAPGCRTLAHVAAGVAIGAALAATDDGGCEVPGRR